MKVKLHGDKNGRGGGINIVGKTECRCKDRWIGKIPQDEAKSVVLQKTMDGESNVWKR